MGWFAPVSRLVGRARVVQAAASLQIGDTPVPGRGGVSGVSPVLAHQIRSGADPVGGWLSGGMVPRAVALQVPVVRRSVNLISGAVGGLPLIRWRWGEQIEPGPLLEQPETWRPYCRTIAATVADLIFYPHAWWKVTDRDSWTGYPTKVVRLDPEYVQVQHAPGSDEISREWATYKGHPVPVDDLIRFDGPDEGFLIHGRSAVTTAIMLELAANRYASPSVPTGYLRQVGQYDLTDDEVRELLDRWEGSFAGGTTRWLNSSVEYESVESTAAELQLVEAREECALQLVRHLGLPPRYAAVTSGDSMTYSNLESERRDLIELCFGPYLAAIEQRLSMSDRNGSPRGQKVRFCLDDFSRAVPLERAHRYQALIPLGVMSRQEARDAEDLSGAAPKIEPAPTPAAEPSTAPEPKRVDAP
ncbi:phage portal protein [Streptomyces sp. NPDC050485]|uniref:phage portal protein n=1 Tax=Streptomyces sp. NPDC050485 TaxID=3365617 RepID=UPI00378BA600